TTLFRSAVQLNEILAVADFRGAGGKDQILQGKGSRNVACRQMLAKERVRVEIDHDGRALPSERKRYRCAFDRGELSANEVLSVVVELLLAQRVAVQPELQYGHARRVVRD